jgi:GNAT superfamily N-acetyltransferase
VAILDRQREHRPVDPAARELRREDLQESRLSRTRVPAPDTGVEGEGVDELWGEQASPQDSVYIDGFGARPKFRVLIAEVAGLPAGYALFFDCYSSLRGHGIFLEDLFVLPQFRGKSVGRALLAHVARITRKTPTASGSCSMFSLGTMKRSSFTEE